MSNYIDDETHCQLRAILYPRLIMILFLPFFQGAPAAVGISRLQARRTIRVH